jgi:hypothetical protein
MTPRTQENPQPDEIDRARKVINRLAEEIAQLSEKDVAPSEYYAGFLERLMYAIAAPAGAIWLKTPQGNLQLQCQSNLRAVGLDRSPQNKQLHDELLRLAAMKGQAELVPPHTSMALPNSEGSGAGNPTDYVILLAPISHDGQLAGIVEIWQDPSRGVDAQRGFLQFMVRMSALAASYTRNAHLRQMVGQQQVWVQLETFARQIHSSLNPTEVAYLVVNEGRRLIQADRVSVGIRQPSTRVLAISGADVVEKRSNLVQLMRELFDSVIEWGERLVFEGTKDESLPPRVLAALDEYLAESNSKFLVCMPLSDDRESKGKEKDAEKLPARSAILVESFESLPDHQTQIARLDVIAKHAAPALYNAGEYYRIPMRFIWLPLAKLQDGLGGKTKAIMYLVAAGLTAFILSMIFVPYPLKIPAKGPLLPVKRVYVYAPTAGQIKDFHAVLKHGDWVPEKADLIRMFDPDLNTKVRGLKTEIQTADLVIGTGNAQGQAGNDNNRDQAFRVEEAKINKRAKVDELEDLRRRMNADLGTPGDLWVKSPLAGIVLSTDFREKLEQRTVKPNEPLLRIGQADPKKPNLKEWELELRIPQKHVGQVLRGFKTKDPSETLDIDFVLTTDPTRSYVGKLRRDKIAAVANNEKSDNDENEPVVMAWVRLDGDDIPADSRVPTSELVGLVSDTIANARIRCGNHAMGYSLFYGVWEFIYEKIIFPLS